MTVWIDEVRLYTPDCDECPDGWRGTETTDIFEAQEEATKHDQEAHGAD